ncbi:hypothetical protein [Candidatus Clavichlamydia salmonicola]|uniref:hypothetical protein n=1 Tax=Candidatus Clavichlamydia salmonicola TaxID=469812 RepID=UPI001890C6B8|nr:hypothetical protein [Candidatus Clavichlamydia salmonicola]
MPESIQPYPPRPAAHPCSSQKCANSFFHTLWNVKISSTAARIMYAIGAIFFHVITLGIPILIHYLDKHDILLNCNSKISCLNKFSPPTPSTQIINDHSSSPQSFSNIKKFLKHSPSIHETEETTNFESLLPTPKKPISHQLFQKSLSDMAKLYESNQAPKHTYSFFCKRNKSLNNFTINPYFTCSYPHSLTYFALTTLPGFSDNLNNNISVNLAMKIAQKQISLLNEHFFICTVKKNDEKDFFRAFIISWIISLAQKVALGKIHAFDNEIQKIIAHEAFMQSHPKATKVSLAVVNLLQELKLMKGIKTVMNFLAFYKPNMELLVDYFQTLINFLHTEMLTNNELIEATMESSPSLIYSLWSRLEKEFAATSLTIPLFKEIKQGSHFQNLENNPLIRKNFILLLLEQPARWKIEPYFLSFLNQIIKKINPLLPGHIDLSHQTAFNIIQKNPSLLKAFNQELQAFHKNKSDPGFMFCFLKSYLPLLTSKVDQKIFSAFISEYELTGLNPFINNLSLKEFNSLCPQNANLQNFILSLDETSFLQSVYENFLKSHAAYHHINPAFTKFFVTHSKNLEDMILSAYQRNIISKEVLTLYKQPPQIHSEDIKDHHTAMQFDKFCEHPFVQTLSASQQLLFFLKNHEEFLNQHPLIQDWYHLASRLHAFASITSSDLIKPNQIEIAHLLSIMTQMTPFSIKKIQAIDNLKKTSKQAQIFHALFLNLESTCSSPPLYSFFVQHQKKIIAILKKYPCDPMIYAQAQYYLNANPEYRQIVSTFVNEHSNKVLKIFNLDTPSQILMSGEQQIFLLLLTDPYLLENTSQIDPNNPLVLFMDNYYPIYIKALEEVSWSNQTIHQEMNLVNQRISKLFTLLLELSPIQERVKKFLDAHLNNQRCLSMIKQALYSEDLRDITSCITTLNSYFTPFALCEATWSLDVPATPSLLQKTKICNGFIQNSFATPKLNDGIHVLHEYTGNHNYYSLIPRGLSE